MAFTKSQVQVTWSAANSVSVSTTSSQESDVVTLDTSSSNVCWKGSITVKSDNAGTPDSTDKTTFKLLFSNGDPDAEADSADEYDSNEVAPGIVLDTNVVDPAIATFEIPVGAKSFKLRAENAGTTNATTVSAQASLTRVAL